MSRFPWGPIDIAKWQETPATTRGLATENDVVEGRAVFYLQLSGDAAAEPFNLQLPACAVLHSKYGPEIPVVVIQVELSDRQTIAGYRPLNGGNGVCSLPELEILEGPDDRFKADRKPRPGA